MSHHPRIICLTGFATVGKDAVGAILARNHGFVRIAFADKLKEMAVNGYPINGRIWYWDGKAEGPLERTNLQYIGEKEREKDPLIWVRLALDRMDDDDVRGRSVVVTDCRYRSEATNLALRGGIVWRVLRPGVGPANCHLSEVEHLTFDPAATIVNTCFAPSCPRRRDESALCPDLSVRVAEALELLG